MSSASGHAVELKNVTKSFARTLANENVTLQIPTGEIMALVGENGAGKTTLMKTLYGLYQPDSGKIRIHGKDVSIRSPLDSIKLGIGMVHQHFMLVPPLSVLENIVLGAEPVKLFCLELAKAHKDVKALAERYSLNVPLNARVEDIGVGVQQRVEILKALYRGAEILILDEPTAVLTPQEADELFKILRELKGQGKTIIIITHKLNEVFAVSDRIAVMRRGRIVGILETPKTSAPEIAELMVGRILVTQIKKPPVTSMPCETDALLAVDHLSFTDKRGVLIVKNVSFDIRGGEIFGIAGVEGNGQSALVECIAGLLRAQSGSIRVGGIAHVPEDRIKRGLVADFPIRDNFILGLHRHKRFSSPFFMKRTSIEANARTLIEEFDVRPPHPDAPARSLSGGNQQKVIIARELSRGADVIIASQPTRGVDIGGIEFIHKTLLRARNEGKAILLVSADLNEILSLSDRIAVMFNGRIVKIFSAERCLPGPGTPKSVDERELGIYMAGHEDRADGAK